ncbi:MAG: hypothetical protein MZV49_11550 [Rhodopseudomonas palustris]|nr:hypothetical protein [Rhodopseudomonas palustris]
MAAKIVSRAGLVDQGSHDQASYDDDPGFDDFDDGGDSDCCLSQPSLMINRNGRRFRRPLLLVTTIDPSCPRLSRASTS